MHLTVSKTLLCGPQLISEWFESPGQTRPFRQGYRTLDETTNQEFKFNKNCNILLSLNLFESLHGQDFAQF